MPSNKTNSAANPGRVCITLSFRLGVLLTLAMVATLMLVMTGATPAQSQEIATVRVSNLDKPVAGGEIIGFAKTFSQSFCTSNVTATLHQVRLHMSAHSWGTPAPVVSIRSYRSGNLGPVLHTLTNPSIDDSLDTAEDFASSGYELAANTTYWVSVFRPDDSGLIELGKTVSTAEDPATEAGWALGDMMLAKYGARWEERESYALRMAVFATGGAPTMSTPVFSDGGCDQKESYEFSVIENTAADTVVGAVPAREPDGDSLTYSVGGTDAAKFNRVFALNASTGEIVAKPGATVDYESKSSYSLTFSVTDGEDASGSTESEPTTDDTAHVSIRVTNIDEPGTVKLSTTDPRVGRSVRASISDPDGFPKPFRIEWARAFRATSAFIPFLPISGSDMTPESYTPTEDDKYQFLRVTIFYFDNECRRVYFNNDCRRTAEGTFAKAVADEDGLIVQQQVVNTPATGELTLWRGDNPYVPRQLIAYNWSIRDADGMIGSRLRYQWITVDPRTGVETKVYNNNSCRCNPQYTYTLRNVARGKAVMVRARFEDDRGNTEVVASRLTTLVPVVGNTAARGGIGVRGTARVGATLSVYTSSITDADGMEDSEFTYQWLTSEGTYNTSIEGATGSTYVPVAADEGMSIKVRIGFTDDAGYYESFTSGGTAPVAAAPVSLFTASTHDTPESHDGSAAFTFELRFSEAPADGVTDSTLEDHALAVIGGTVTDVSQLETGKNLRWEITVQPSGNEEVIVTLPPTIDCAAQGAICTGDGRMLSVALAILVPGPQNAPAITGTARVGETLTASTTGITDSDGLTNATFTYQWLADDAVISGATGSTYMLVAADVGKAIKVQVSFSDDADNAESLTSAATAAVTAANSPATGAPTITGTARVGETLTASTTGITDSDGLTNATFTYQWIKLDSNLNDSDISGATSSTYTLVAGDADTGIKVRVSFTDDAGNTESLTNESALIVMAANNPATGAPTISGTAQVGETLTASTTGIADSDGLANVTFTYQWLADDAAISGATASTHTLVAADADTGIKVRVSFTDDAGNTESLTNESALIVMAANNPATGAPTISGTAQVGETLTASTTGIADSDGLTNATFTYQWLADDAAISGATASTYTLVAADAGKAIKVRVSFTDDAGNTESLTSGASAAVTAANSPATGAPTISGTAQVGETLTASTTGITDSDGLTNATFTYQWIKLDSNLNDSDISGATSSTYTLVAGDADTGIKVRVSFTDDAGNTESLTNESVLIVTAANSPATGAPTISGTAQVGETLTASATGITDSDGLTNATFTYQWIKLDSNLNDSDISGATSSTYTLVAADAGTGIKVRVSFTDDRGNTESLTTESALIVTAANSPAAGAPTISGTAQVGETLAASTTGITDSDGLTSATFTYQWLADDAAISGASGATGSTYTLVAADAGKAIEVQVSFTDDAGNAESLTSAASAAVTAANSPATGAPTISGTAQVGETLTASTTGIADSDGLTNATFTYQWLADDADIAGATGSTYTLVAADAGKTVKVQVSFTDDAGNAESLTSAASAAVTAANSPATGAPTISGTAQVGETLAASTTGITDSDGLTNATFTYQWLADDADIAGATGSTYTLVAADAGKAIEVQVSFTDDAGNAESLTSAASAAVTAVNSPATGAPTISGTAQVGETLTASATGITDSDGLTNATFTYQWLADDADIAGATGSTYTLVAADSGKAIKVQVSFTDDAGNAESLTSVASAAVTAAPRQTRFTAATHSAPASHDGSAAFTFELRFSEESPLSYRTLRDHAFTVTGGEVVKARRLEQGKNVRWEITVRPDGNGTVTIVLPVTTDCAAEGAICTAGGRMLSNELTFTVPGPSTEQPTQENSAAAGAPTVSGTARVGETLTASATGISDSDGLTGATFTYQWLADDAAISGATGSTYTLVAADAGKAVKVQVSFTDDADNDETLTSAATSAVEAAAQATQLTASVHGVPASHDGSAAFTFELRFSEESPLSYRTLRDHAFTVTGGEVVKARRLEQGKNVRWETTVRPDGNGTVTIVLPVTTDCSSQGAICTEEGRPLSNRLELTVAGPGG